MVKVKCQLLSNVQHLVTLWTVACQIPLSKKFSRQENCSGLPCPPPGDLQDPRIEIRSPALQVDSLLSEKLGSRLSMVKLLNKEGEWNSAYKQRVFILDSNKYSSFILKGRRQKRLTQIEGGRQICCWIHVEILYF